MSNIRDPIIKSQFVILNSNNYKKSEARLDMTKTSKIMIRQSIELLILINLVIVNKVCILSDRDITNTQQSLATYIS